MRWHPLFAYSSEKSKNFIGNSYFYGSRETRLHLNKTKKKKSFLCFVFGLHYI